MIVVDDERFVRMGIVGETDWASLGCEVVGEAENGLDALELVHEKNPELMICDIRMPKMNGLEMLKKLREEKNPVQVIFLTAYSEFSYAREALKLYAFDYLLKPVRGRGAGERDPQGERADRDRSGEAKRYRSEQICPG